MTLKAVSPLDAQRMLESDAVLVDVREPQEIEREKIEGAVVMPLTSLKSADFDTIRGRKVIFICHSGGRTRIYAGQLAAKAAGVCELYVMSGGILAWRRAGLPTIVGPRPPGLLSRLFGG